MIIIRIICFKNIKQKFIKMNFRTLERVPISPTYVSKQFVPEVKTCSFYIVQGIIFNGSMLLSFQWLSRYRTYRFYDYKVDSLRSFTILSSQVGQGEIKKEAIKTAKISVMSKWKYDTIDQPRKLIISCATIFHCQGFSSKIKK